MGYYLYAWLENGKPQLQVIDAQSKSICLSWSYQATDENCDSKEIQRLFRDLLLLTCKQEMRNYGVFEVKPPKANEHASPLPEELLCA